jgi:CBS domain-containing protein
MLSLPKFLQASRSIFRNLPVISRVAREDHSLVGIITQTDIFRALVDITGVFTGGVQFAFCLEEGSLLYSILSATI